MQIPKRSIFTIVAVIISAFASHCLAASEVTMPLAGQVIRSGSNIELSSTDTLDAASVYYYSISGTLATTSADFELLLGGNTTTLEGLLDAVDPNLVPYLSGSVVNISDKLPFTCVNVLKKGSVSLFTGTVFGTVRLKAGIKKTGIAFGDITNVSFGIKLPHLGTKVDKTDTLTFTGGQIVVGTFPPGTIPDPDLSFVTPAGLVGVANTGTASYTYPKLVKKGKAISVPVLLENSGTTPDGYVVKVTGTAPDFDQKFIYGGKNVTAAVTGTGGFRIPPNGKKTTVYLDAGDAKTLAWIVKFTGTTPDSISPVLTGTSVLTGSSDAAQLTVDGTAP